jgi:hypothetical protein
VALPLNFPPQQLNERLSPVPDQLTGSGHDRHVGRHQLPPLAAEDYVCEACALVYSDITIEHAVSVIDGLPAAIRKAVSVIPTQALSQRPSPHA